MLGNWFVRVRLFALFPYENQFWNWFSDSGNVQECFQSFDTHLLILNFCHVLQRLNLNYLCNSRVRTGLEFQDNFFFNQETSVRNVIKEWESKTQSFSVQSRNLYRSMYVLCKFGRISVGIFIFVLSSKRNDCPSTFSDIWNDLEHSFEDGNVSHLEGLRRGLDYLANMANVGPVFYVWRCVSLQ